MKNDNIKFRNLEILYDSGEVDLKIIKDVERIFNIRFPQLYIELMSKHNSVSVEPSYISYYDSNNEEGIVGIGFDSFETELNPDPQDIRRQYIYDDQSMVMSMCILLVVQERDILSVLIIVMTPKVMSPKSVS